MTQRKIYEYAYKWAMQVWSKTDLQASQNPDSDILREREQNAWNDLIEIEQMIKKQRLNND